MESNNVWEFNEHPARSTRVAIFDYDKSGRNPLIRILGNDILFHVADIFNNANELVKGILSSRADLILINVAGTGLNGLAVIRRLKSEFPYLQLLAVISSGTDTEIYSTIMEGASGYILQDELEENLKATIRALRIGGSPMSRFVARRVIDIIKQKACMMIGAGQTQDYKLTSREKDVLRCIVNGKNYKTTGNELHISYETVRSHMKKIYGKLQVASLTEVVAKSINFHIV